MSIKFLAAVLITGVFVSCGANDTKPGTTEPAKATEATMPHQHDSTVKKADFSAIKFDAEKDFVCGMPIKAGVEDTLTYKGKVYGFCSKDCKDEFVKNPESFLAKK